MNYCTFFSEHDFGLWGNSRLLFSTVRFIDVECLLVSIQMVFMDTTATIPTGAMAERWKCQIHLLFLGFSYPCLYIRLSETGFGRRMAFPIG